MALLGWLFIGWLFRPYLPADQIDSYIAGLILLAAAPCTAMVFVWSNLTKGEPHFTLSQVALNDIDHGRRLRAHRRPAAGPFGHHRALGHAVLSVVLYIVVPVIIAQILRNRILGERRRGCACATAAYLAALVARGAAGDARPALRVSGRTNPRPAARSSRMLAVPILIQVYFNAGVAYLLNRAAGEAHCVAGPSALIGASNFFELAVAAAISLFGFDSGAALATVVGVLIEVPVMLSVVKIVNEFQGLVRVRSGGAAALARRGNFGAAAGRG